MARFRHPDIKDGSISVGETSVPVVKGIVELPEKMGKELRWERVSDDDAPAPKKKAGSKK